MNENTHDLYTENVSQELDDHYKNFGKYASDVDYTIIGYCNFCNTRIDDLVTVPVLVDNQIDIYS